VSLPKSAIGFFTTIPVKSDIEELRKNLWFFPFAGAVVGMMIAAPLYIFQIFSPSLLLLSVLIYIMVEGINHIDGLADFGDALFAPQSRKTEALKDTKTGAGGITFVVVYLLVLFQTLPPADFLTVVFAQILAKYGMLLLMVTSDPCWKGMASYFMETAKKSHLVTGFLPVIPFLYLDFLTAVIIFVTALIVVYVLKKYSEGKFGGINGDVLGATNCIVFAHVLLLSAILT
jgi:adenosylcobinamide-GDP ribazoletransferase